MVGSGAIADLSLMAGMRGDRGEQMRLALAALDMAREHGLLDAREVGEVHTAYGVALAAEGRHDEALPSWSAASSCAGCGRSRSTSPTA